MTPKIAERDALYKKAIAQLKKDTTNMKEKIKLLEKRLDFTQDENTKLAVEGQAIMQGVNHILQIGVKLAERERVNQDMGLEKPVDDVLPKKKVNAGIG
jgi:hypothetical protein